jgi:hypothetical protein
MTHNAKPEWAQNLSDFPVVFISYHEPNAQQNYDNLAKVLKEHNKAEPLWVQGVTGFDAAHKAAAALARESSVSLGQGTGSHFYTVDGDTQINKDFWVTANAYTLRDLPGQDPLCTTYSWRYINNVNRLAYGNGGLKLWSYQFVDAMVTHEAADVNTPVVDFCWDTNYIQMQAIVGTTYINASPYQAWRAGFREGVKLLLQGGKPIDLSTWRKQDNETNIRRMLHWFTVGLDAEYGWDAMRGASAGFKYAHIDGHPVNVVHDYKKLAQLYTDGEAGERTGDAHAFRLEEIKTFLGQAIPSLGAKQSQLVKTFLVYDKQPIIKREDWQWL